MSVKIVMAVNSQKVDVDALVKKIFYGGLTVHTHDGDQLVNLYANTVNVDIQEDVDVDVDVDHVLTFDCVYLTKEQLEAQRELARESGDLE